MLCGEPSIGGRRMKSGLAPGEPAVASSSVSEERLPRASATVISSSGDNRPGPVFGESTRAAAAWLALVPGMAASRGAAAAARFAAARRRAPAISRSVGSTAEAVGREAVGEAAAIVLVVADEDGKPWKVAAVPQGDKILVDFSPKGGPADVEGQWLGTGGIKFPDGNVWAKLN